MGAMARHLFLEYRHAPFICKCGTIGEAGSDTVQKPNAVLTTIDNRSSGDLDHTQECAKLTRLQAEKVTTKLQQKRGNLMLLAMVVIAWRWPIKPT